MKILYGVQGTGNGHLSRAIELLPEFEKHGTVDVLISGEKNLLPLPFDVKYRFKGLTLGMNEKGKLSFSRTFAQNHLRPFIHEIRQLNIEKYDVVISDFEPITAWSALMKNKECVGIGNQFSMMHPNVPMPHEDRKFARFITENMVPVTDSIGIHYEAYNSHIETPIISREIKNMKTDEQGFILVYLPAHDPHYIALVANSLRNQQFEWRIFTPFVKHKTHFSKRVTFHPLSRNEFQKSLATCSAIISAAGFGLTSEALYLGKKICAIPIKKHFEQECNGAALKNLGVYILPAFNLKHSADIDFWLSRVMPVKMNYEDNSFDIVDKALCLAQKLEFTAEKDPVKKKFLSLIV
jgi:uncharacterized protein (TIGR00661 family)